MSTSRAARRGRRWWLLVIVITVTVAASAVATLISATGSRRDGVALEQLILAPAALWDDPGQGVLWKDFAQHVGDKTSAREWAGPSGSLLHEEVSKHSGGSFGGRYYFFSADPADKYGKSYPGLVRKVDPPTEIGADSANLFCGNTGKSARGALDDCQIWGYWARYGQYVVYLEVTDLRLPQRDFTAMAKRWDTTITATLLEK